MPTLASPDGRWIWSLILAFLLFWPLRRLLFVLVMRRALRRETVDPPRQRLLRRRAGITAALLGLFFAAVYVHVLAARLAIPPP